MAKEIVMLVSWKGKIVSGTPLTWCGHDLKSFLTEEEAKYPGGTTLSWAPASSLSERVQQKLSRLWQISSAMYSDKIFVDRINRLDILAELSDIRSFV